MGDNYQYYHYDPSMAAAIIFAAAFLLSTVEWIGFGARIFSSTESPHWSLGPYVAQAILLLVAPALFAASVYMTLGRIIQLTQGEKHSMIRQRWLTKIFVAGDVLSFLAQSAGASTQASNSSPDSATKGKTTILGGLALQIIFFSFFVIVAVRFDRRIAQSSREENNNNNAPPTEVNWRKHLIALYVASALILVRSIFRVAEYIQGDDGYIMGHEVFLYVFDATLMLGVVVLFNSVHPSEVKAGIRGGRFARGVLMRTL
ncbi:MAG: hypothetical protein Q9190_003912 [Brigantiaea leucoxantha]